MAGTARERKQEARARLARDCFHYLHYLHYFHYLHYLYYLHYLQCTFLRNFRIAFRELSNIISLQLLCARV